MLTGAGEKVRGSVRLMHSTRVHDEILLDGDARSSAFLQIDETAETSAHIWHVHQIFHDADGDGDFGIWADVDLDATQDEGEARFSTYHVGFVEDVL